MNSAFLIIFIAMIALMALVPFCLRKLEIPSVISLLVVGMLIGPSGLNMIQHLADWLGFLGSTPEQTAQGFNSLIHTLGSLGLMFLMALAGMEADFKLISSARKPVITLSLLTFIIPATVGYLVYDHFHPESLAGKLLYASLFASHSVGIVFPVMRELKLSQTRFGASVLISTIITDIASIILLAVSVQLFRHHSGASGAGPGTLSIFDHLPTEFSAHQFVGLFLLIVLVYLAVTILGVGYLGRRLLTAFQPGEDMLITLILVVILGSVLLGELLGINLVVGAFIAGLGMSKIIKARNMLFFRRFESIGYGFLIPFLFVSIGMDTDFSVFRDLGSLPVVALTVVGLVGSKVLSGYISMRINDFDRPASLAAGLMTVPQLSATLAAAAIGRSMGILEPVFFNAIIILSIVTTLPVPTLVRLVLKNSEEKFRSSPTFSVPQVIQDDELL